MGYDHWTRVILSYIKFYKVIQISDHNYLFSLKGFPCIVVGWLQLLNAIYSQLYKGIKMAKTKSIVVCGPQLFDDRYRNFDRNRIQKPIISDNYIVTIIRSDLFSVAS
jgi:hypothetical protein